MLFAFKQLVGVLLSPLPFAVLLVLVGVALRFLRRPRAALGCFISAALVAYLSSTNLVARTLLRPLEQAHAPLDQHAPLPQVRFIVVLGAEYNPNPTSSITAQLGRDGLQRGVEGVRLARLLPHARLILSGGSPEPGAAPGRGYEQLAAALGVPQESVLVMDQAIDTAGEARDIAAYLGREPFLLVTGAYHMPRALRLMRAAGANPIPAPTGQVLRPGERRVRPRDLIPSSSALRVSELCIHEYLGLAATATPLGGPASRPAAGTPLAP